MIFILPVSNSIKSPANIRLGYVMFESGGVKLYGKIRAII
jgi:hypothetical protein